MSEKRSIFLMVHPRFGDVMAVGKGQGQMAIHLYRAGYRALSESSNAALKRITEQQDSPNG